MLGLANEVTLAGVLLVLVMLLLINHNYSLMVHQELGFGTT